MALTSESPVPLHHLDLAPWVDALGNHDLPALRALIAATPHPLPTMSSLAPHTSPLHHAVMEGWLPGFMALLPVSDTNAVDSNGDTPLLLALNAFASVKDTRAMVRALAPLCDVNQPDTTGVTPLAKAVASSDVKLVNTLLAHGADPRLKSRGAPVLLAAWMSDVSSNLHDRLLPLVDAQATDEHGYTLLHHLLMVSDLSDEARVQRWVQLCARGANPHQPNQQGQTAMQMLAERQDHLVDAVQAAMIAWERDALQGVVAGVEAPAASAGTPSRPRL